MHIGKVADVTGGPGGYDFRWAWSSGWRSGRLFLCVVESRHAPMEAIPSAWSDAMRRACRRCMATKKERDPSTVA
jgi:hypothetical protein